jgi:hypothetical protein
VANLGGNGKLASPARKGGLRSFELQALTQLLPRLGAPVRMARPQALSAPANSARQDICPPCTGEHGAGPDDASTVAPDDVISVESPEQRKARELQRAAEIAGNAITFDSCGMRASLPWTSAWTPAPSVPHDARGRRGASAVGALIASAAQAANPVLPMRAYA